MKNIKIYYRLIIGFGFIVLLLAVSVSSTLLHVGAIKENTDRIVNLRVPTSLSSSNMGKNVYASLASLRGWMLTGDLVFKTERAKIWQEIARTRISLDALSKNWGDPNDFNKWNEFKSILDKFSMAQAQVETIAHTENAYPATKILTSIAAPRAAEMYKNITMMIGLQLSENRGVGEDRIKLLGIMADIRGTLGGAIAAIRAYLLTGDTKFADEYRKLWVKNDKHFIDLSHSAWQLSPEQETAFENFTVARIKFSPLPEKMFEIRASKKWDMATYLLINEAMPRADMLLALLLGAIQRDGTQTVGMIASQRSLLEDEAGQVFETINELFVMQWGLLVIGVLLGIAITFFTARSIASPVITMTAAMKRLANGDLNAKVPAYSLGNEIGDMAEAVEVFKQNAIERAHIENKQKETLRELVFQKRALDEHAIVSITDAKGSIIYVNDKFCSISGYSREELMGEKHRILNSGEHPAAFLKDIWKTITKGHTWHGELKNKNKSGGFYWVKTTIVPTLNNDGKPFQYVRIRTDITESKELEIDLAKQKDILARQTDKLEVALISEKEYSALQKQFVSMASHEFRTPLTIIDMSAQRLLRRLDTMDKEQIKERAITIRDAAKRITGLIESTLNAEKIEEGKLGFMPTSCDLRWILMECIKLQTDATGYKINADLNNLPDKIIADSGHLNQIFDNILSNAVKYSPNNKLINVTGRTEGNYALVSISDHGIGIPEDEKSQMFKRFFRTNRSIGIPGTGIGLNLVKQLVELQGGEISLGNVEGWETTFNVRLPREES